MTINSVDTLRSMVDHPVRITYTNGVTANGILRSFHLGYNNLVIEIDKDPVFIILNSVRSIQKVK